MRFLSQKQKFKFKISLIFFDSYWLSNRVTSIIIFHKKCFFFLFLQSTFFSITCHCFLIHFILISHKLKIAPKLDIQCFNTQKIETV